MVVQKTRFTEQALALALELTTGISTQDRFDRLLATVRQLLGCDASALLAYDDKQFSPLAINGLTEDVLGRRFVITEHPRLEAIARAGDIVRFPADTELPDPYDGLIPSHTDQLKVHACIGLPLLAEQGLIGALTIDGLDPHQFDQFSDDQLRTVTALAAATLNNALLLDQLEKRSGNLAGAPVASAGAGAAAPEIIGQSGPMQALGQQIGAVAGTDLTVLIQGETGVGKELVASAIHAQSSRAGRPLIYLNCAALPESVAESELFGHVKGAFTGAISNRSGKFELADRGTLFLDEMGELPLSLQAKLLRVLQQGDLQRIGDDRSLKVDVRIIAATNRDLQQEVDAGRFRADLYHRLSVFPIAVPPLRARGNDVVLLAGFFAERIRARLGLEQLRLSAAARHCLQAYAWPGNVRELEHSIYRAAVLARSRADGPHVLIEPMHFEGALADVRALPAMQAPAATTAAGAPAPGVGLREATEQFQRQLIDEALKACAGNWAAAARYLELDAGNLHRLAKRLGLK